MSNLNSNKTVVLISFYNPKQIGVKFLQAALEKSGYSVLVIAFKGYNSKKLNMPTQLELNLLKQQIQSANPLFVGLSVNSSFVLEVARVVQKELITLNLITLWGGVFSTLMPQKAFEAGASYVIAGEGEDAIVEFAAALEQERPLSALPNLVYKTDNDEIIQNPLLPLKNNIDSYGKPSACSEHRIYIENNKVNNDANLNSFGYELSATRGCPFDCSYCSSPNLKRMYGSKGYVRYRSVNYLMDELLDAKWQIKKLKFVHFWDEIFPDDKDWIDEFAYRYKNEISLPFEIWGHPLRINDYTIKKLVWAGLFEITVGIQSGSERIRKDVFNRHEKEEHILRTAEVLQSCGVPHIVFDFMLRHSFETLEDLKLSFELCMKLKQPYQLQLHGLGFLPGTDICKTAIDKGIYTTAQLEKLMFGEPETVFGEFWGKDTYDAEIDFWYDLIYLTQFPLFRKYAALYATNFQKYHKKLKAVVKIANAYERVLYYKKKSEILFGEK